MTRSGPAALDGSSEAPAADEAPEAVRLRARMLAVARECRSLAAGLAPRQSRALLEAVRKLEASPLDRLIGPSA